MSTSEKLKSESCWERSAGEGGGGVGEGEALDELLADGEGRQLVAVVVVHDEEELLQVLGVLHGIWGEERHKSVQVMRHS